MINSFNWFPLQGVLQGVLKPTNQKVEEVQVIQGVIEFSHSWHACIYTISYTRVVRSIALPAIYKLALSTSSQSFCDKNRSSKVFNHLMTVKEGIGCLGWVTVVILQLHLVHTTSLISAHLYCVYLYTFVFILRIMLTGS